MVGALAGKVGTGVGGMLAVGEVVGWEDTALWVAEGTLVVGALVAGVGRELLVVVVGILVEEMFDVGILVVGTLVVGTLVVGTLVVGTLVAGTLVAGTLVVETLVAGTLVVAVCS